MFYKNNNSHSSCADREWERERVRDLQRSISINTQAKAQTVKALYDNNNNKQVLPFKQQKRYSPQRLTTTQAKQRQQRAAAAATERLRQRRQLAVDVKLWGLCLSQLFFDLPETCGKLQAWNRFLISDFGAECVLCKKFNRLSCRCGSGCWSRAALPLPGLCLSNNKTSSQTDSKVA